MVSSQQAAPATRLLGVLSAAGSSIGNSQDSNHGNGQDSDHGNSAQTGPQQQQPNNLGRLTTTSDPPGSQHCAQPHHALRPLKQLQAASCPLWSAPQACQARRAAHKHSKPKTGLSRKRKQQPQQAVNLLSRPPSGLSGPPRTLEKADLYDHYNDGRGFWVSRLILKACHACCIRHPHISKIC